MKKDNITERLTKLERQSLHHQVSLWALLGVILVMILTGCSTDGLRICDSYIYDSPTDHEYVGPNVVFKAILKEEFIPRCDYHNTVAPYEFHFESTFDWYYKDSLPGGEWILIKIRNGTKYGIRRKNL